MNPSAEQGWSRPPDQPDPMAHMSPTLDDLGELFEFGDIHLDSMASVDSAPFDGTHPSTPFDEITEAQAISNTSTQDFGVHAQFAVSQTMDHSQQRRYNGQPPTSHPYNHEAMYQPSMQQQYHPGQPYPFQGMQGFAPNQHIPPTPNSFEMHGEAGRFMQQQMDPQQRGILEQRYHPRKEDAIAFTPMASPVGTPQYNVPPEYTIPGAYFSPLTSPMLLAQNQNGQTTHQHHQGYYTNPSTAPSSNATSPLDPNIDIDMMVDEISLTESANAQAKRASRRKPATPRSGGPLARVKQSPIQKAVKRKSGTMLASLARTKEIEGVMESHRSVPSGGLQMPRNDSSENGSISPEPLCESLMGPPPRPTSSVGPSPALAGQRKDGSLAQLGKAATPKSLLSMRGGKQSSGGLSEPGSSNGIDDQMDLEELQLPAAATDDATSRPSLPQLNTRISSTTPTDDTPRASARKTPKLGASSTASSVRPSTAVASPSITGSPITASTPGALLKDRKLDGKAGRGSKKRGSMSGSGSTLVSPALRPRISPSIKPLLPEGASLQSPTHALLLASKSNYQNLLEGNHLPGVHYPDSLSTGLTSKRTSHKVAEQGRRNRINEALKEMQSLLPKAITSRTAKENSNSDGSPDAGDGEGKDSKEDAQAKSNSSKAATVESANEYIRKLQKENSLLLQIKKEHEEMSRRLEEQIDPTLSTERSGSSAVDSASPARAMSSVSTS